MDGLNYPLFIMPLTAPIIVVMSPPPTAPPPTLLKILLISIPEDVAASAAAATASPVPSAPVNMSRIFPPPKPPTIPAIELPRVPKDE